MTTYICKCGRVVAKSTKADNTGNRDTAGCEGCPYLLPWGPMVWDDQQKGYTQDVKGYECRMSPTIEYTTTYHGCADDKCSLHIVSLDLDFLDEVQAWIYDNAADTLSAGFSRGSMRGIEFSNKGRYSLSVLCAQNKKGVAAKAALLARFFGPGGHRLDMTPQQEKAHILAAIEAGKAQAQKREDKKVEYIISRNTENGLTYAYYRGAFWFWDERAGRWFLSPYAKELYAGFSAGQPGSKPEDMLYSGNFEALEDWDIPAKVIDDLLSRNPKKEKRENPTPAAEDVQPCAPIASDAPPFPSPSANADVQQGGKDDAANPTDAAPTSPADAGTATQSLFAAAPASLEAKSAPAAFDFGADAETNMALMQDAQVFMAGSMARVMAAKRAHDRTANNYRGSWGKWCDLVGISRDTGDNMVRVAEQFGNIQINGQNLIDVQPLKLLYATSKASTPPEIRERVENLDITTHKQYQEAMAQLKAEREAKEKAEQEARHAASLAEALAALGRKERDDAHATALRYKAECDRRAAEQQRVEGLLATRDEQLRAAQAEAAKWKNIGAEMQTEVENRDDRIRELEQSQTVVAGTADPEEIERRAQEIAKAQIAENDAKWAEITENQGRQLRELLANSGASQAVKTAAASVQTILDEMFQVLSLEDDDVAGQAALEDLEDLLFDWSDSIHDMLHPEDALEDPSDDEEGEPDGES